MANYVRGRKYGQSAIAGRVQYQEQSKRAIIYFISRRVTQGASLTSGQAEGKTPPQLPPPCLLQRFLTFLPLKSGRIGTSPARPAAPVAVPPTQGQQRQHPLVHLLLLVPVMNDTGSERRPGRRKQPRTDSTNRKRGAVISTMVIFDTVRTSRRRDVSSVCPFRSQTLHENAEKQELHHNIRDHVTTADDYKHIQSLLLRILLR